MVIWWWPAPGIGSLNCKFGIGHRVASKLDIALYLSLYLAKELNSDGQYVVRRFFYADLIWGYHITESRKHDVTFNKSCKYPVFGLRDSICLPSALTGNPDS